MIVGILKILTKLAFHFSETPVGSDGSLVCRQASQTCLRSHGPNGRLTVHHAGSSQLLLHLWGRPCCHHVGWSVDLGQESEIEENMRSGFGMIEGTTMRSTNAGVAPSSSRKAPLRPLLDMFPSELNCRRL